MNNVELYTNHAHYLTFTDEKKCLLDDGLRADDKKNISFTKIDTHDNLLNGKCGEWKVAIEPHERKNILYTREYVTHLVR